MNKKILFVNSINTFSELENRYPPLGIGYLISYLRKMFGNNFFIFRIISDNLNQELKVFNPDIVCITSVSQNYNLAKEHAKTAKEQGFPVIIGGIHISMLPESLSGDMDVGVIGEGERTIVELVKLFLAQGGFNDFDMLNSVKGIVYKKGNELILTPKRELIDPLDEIPFPSRDMFNISGHSYIFSSRGCPYRCQFCASARYWHKVRYFSAEYVVNEIKELINRYNVKLISFYDDLMMASLDRLRKIVALLEQEGLLGKVKFTANARANLMTEETVKLLKKMNVVSVGMGLESGSERILQYLKKNNVSIAMNHQAIEMLKKYKITANASFVIGSPDETREEILETLNFIKKNRLDLFDVYVLTPYPGTPIWDYAKAKGLVSNDMDWAKLDISFSYNYKKAIILSEILNREELNSLFKIFKRHFFLLMVKNIFKHPYLIDVPKILIAKTREKLAVFLSKIKLKVRSCRN